jgi:orotate phosphoribosyltransferase
VLLALDRQERAPGSDFSAVQEVRSQYQIPVISVINLADLMQHVSRTGQADELSSMRLYRDRYGLAD